MGHYFMERDTRFELATSTLARSHSTTELVPQNCWRSVPTDALYSKSPPNKSTEIFNLLKKISEQRHGKTSAGNQFRTRGLRQRQSQRRKYRSYAYLRGRPPTPDRKTSSSRNVASGREWRSSGKSSCTCRDRWHR